jgi:hypothetical protein
MTDAAGAPAWPGNDFVSIAFAAKVALLEAAFRTCGPGPISAEHEELLAEVASVTRSTHVEGRDFPDFLSYAQEQLEDRARKDKLDRGPAAETLADLLRADPDDVIGELYDSLKCRAADLYQPFLGERFDPKLVRQVLDKRAKGGTVFGGSVPPTRSCVNLVFYARDFDLRRLALVQYVLVHELVCHIGARAVATVDDQRADPEVAMFFADGFMDRVAWELVVTWLEDEELAHGAPLGHLRAEETRYAYARASTDAAWDAGKAAWSNCTSAAWALMRAVVGGTSVEPEQRRSIKAEAEERSRQTALRMNACPCALRKKDAFVDLARAGGNPPVLARFAEIARRRADPLDLFEWADAQRPSPKVSAGDDRNSSETSGTVRP